VESVGDGRADREEEERKPDPEGEMGDGKSSTSTNPSPPPTSTSSTMGKIGWREAIGVGVAEDTLYSVERALPLCKESWAVVVSMVSEDEEALA
jgi:hypothetical protein